MPATEGIKRTGVSKGYFSLEDIEEFSKLNEAYDLNSLPVNHSGLTLFMSTCIGAKHIPKKELNDILQCLSNSKNFNIDKVENSFGNTALMWCCANGETNICLKLIEKFNANPFIEDKCKKNTLHLLIAKGHIRQIPIIKLIISRSNIKDHVNDQMEGGFTALHLACARRDWSYIKLLIEGGASLEIRDNNEMTPLYVLNLSDIERLKIIDQGLSCDDKSIIKDYDSYVNGQEQIATFCKQTFYTEPNILKNKVNQDYNVNNFHIQKSVKHKDFHQQRSKSSISIKGKLEDFDLTNNKLKTINANKTAISLKQVKKVETLNAPKPALIQVKPLQRDKFRYGIAGAAFLIMGIGLVITSLYIDLCVMITAVAAYILAGYYAYKAYKCIQNEKRIVSNSNIPSVEKQVIDILAR